MTFNKSWLKKDWFIGLVLILLFLIFAEVGMFETLRSRRLQSRRQARVCARPARRRRRGRGRRQVAAGARRLAVVARRARRNHRTAVGRQAQRDRFHDAVRHAAVRRRTAVAGRIARNPAQGKEAQPARQPRAARHRIDAARRRQSRRRVSYRRPHRAGDAVYPDCQTDAGDDRFAAEIHAEIRATQRAHQR